MSVQQHQPDRVDATALINSNDGSYVSYDGPFEMLRDGAYVEVILPVDEMPSIHRDVATRIAESPHDLAVLMVHGEFELSGLIDSRDVIENELIIRIKDGNFVELADLEDEKLPEGIDR